MKYLSYLALGILFGITLIKSEVASWFRIFEMFQFKNFHMYGVIGSAVVLGAIATFILKKQNTFSGEAVTIKSKAKGFKNYLFGGIIFGLGWALGGACPGPMYALLGSGFISIIVLLCGAVLGAFTFGLIKHKLPF
ncbi:YeeE/YedE family protein [Aurantibacter sp.]|uniref:YeeE/YedE family protein n=1 Tax=Aurantibacter sp. TaxID=2807103 RepID=UPI0035C8007B